MSSVEKILGKSGDPELAFRQWIDFQAAGGRLKDTSPLLHLFGNSRSLVQHLTNFPKLAASPKILNHLTRPKERKQFLTELRVLFGRALTSSGTGSGTGRLASAMRLLRNYKRQEMIRIAARDLSQDLSKPARFEEVGGELSHLAEALIEFARRAAFHLVNAGRGHRHPFSVLGLGKLGGCDLNFSSDIDILYLFGLEGAVPLKKQKDLFESFTLVSETMTKILQERTGDGFVFRVDLDLRPEGRSGPLVNSLPALILYYEIAAAPWERAAMLKARPVAGDMKLGEEAVKGIDPFLFRRSLDFSIVTDLKKMKEKINRELKSSTTDGFHVKLGPGGIREIEFFVTAFQLVYGGKEPELQTKNTLQALRGLKGLNRIPSRDAEKLEEAYIFLRRIENRLQMMDERQVHALPTDPRELLALARRMGFDDPPPFLDALREKTGFVASCFEQLAP